MDSAELQKLITKAIDEMKGYEAMGGDMVRQAIADFEEIKAVVLTYPDCDLTDVKPKITVLNGQIGPFRRMAPKVGAALDALMGILG